MFQGSKGLGILTAWKMVDRFEFDSWGEAIYENILGI